MHSARRTPWNLAAFSFLFAFLIYSPAALRAQTAKDAAAPAASEEELSYDRKWREGSSKYDAARAALLKQVDESGKDGPFRPDWDSLAKYEIPQWFRGAKFGIFIHWGVYSVPAFGNEWYPRNMYTQGSDEYKHHLEKYGPQNKFGYKDFIPMFKAEHFDPRAWAALFKESGARYVVPVFEHHDGFTMYASDLSDWTAAKMGPKRDLAGELVAAVRAAGLHVGASSHRIEHDWFLDAGRKIDSDVKDKRYAAFYGPAHASAKDDSGHLGIRAYLGPDYSSDWLARDAEIVNKYHPEVMWFDWWIGNPALESYLRRFAAFYYNESLKRGAVGVINYKGEAMPAHTAVLDIERGQLSSIRADFWQTDTSISNKSWGYIEGDSFKTPQVIVQQLVDIVSKNGNLLLNFGPRSDGTISTEVQQVLRDVGGWLRMNGEAIYDTKPWKVFGEGPTNVVEGAFHDTDTQSFTAEDFRFTSKGKNLYAIEFAWPASGKAMIRSLGLDKPEPKQKVRSVNLLGSAEKLKFDQQVVGLHIDLPSQAPGKYAYAFRIVFDD